MNKQRRKRELFEQNKARYNLRAKQRSFKPGDVVYIKNQKQSSAGNDYTQKLGALRKQVYVKNRVENSKDMYELVDGNNKSVGTYHASENHTKQTKKKKQ